MQNNQPIYTTAKAIEYPRTILDTSQYKNTRAYDKQFRPNCDVTISSLNIAIKNHKQPKQMITAENSRIY